MDEAITTTELFTPIVEGEKILGDNSFIIINEQILFWHAEKKCVVFSQINEEQDYNVDDYMQLPENAPYQLIEKKLVFMAAPLDIHQKISGDLFLEIGLYVKSNKLGHVRFSPCDVHFDKDNVCQPDLLFISIGRSSIIQKWIYGAPDFVVEILSESNPNNDLVAKKRVYGKFDVVEYWIVYPKEEKVEVFHNQNKEMQLVQTAKKSHTIRSIAIQGFDLEVVRIFE